MGGVVNENVDPAQFGYGLFDDVPAMIRTLYVAGDEHSLPAGVFYESLSLLSILVLVEVGDEHVCTLARISDRNCPAYTAVCAGDDRLLICKPTAASVGALAVVRHRFHNFRLARHRLWLLGKRGLRMLIHGSRHLAKVLERIPANECSTGERRAKFLMLAAGGPSFVRVG